MAKIKVPRGTFEDTLNLDAERPFPSIQCLDKKQRVELEKRIPRIIDFHESRLSFQAVNYIGNWVSKNGFEEKDILDDKPSKSGAYFCKDPWQKSSMLVVREGRKPITEGFRLIEAHADSPCLRVKPKPFRIAWDPDEIWNHLGVRLSTTAYGGILVPNWVGQPVDVIGYTIKKNGSRKDIQFPGFLGISSDHVDDSEDEKVKDAFAPEKSLEIITGFSSIPNFLNSLGFKHPDDLANTCLWAVPVNQMRVFSEYDWNLLVGYGHDDRTGCFSTIDAIVRMKKPEYTSIAWVSDNEEIYDPAPAGVDGPFFDIFLNKMLEQQEKKEKRKISVSEKTNMYLKSEVLNADVTVGPYGKDAENMDWRSAAKLGLGVAIDGGDIQGSDPKFIRKMRNLALDDKKGRICHQVCGQFYDQDKRDIWYGYYRNVLSSKGVSGACLSIPCASCHSPVEIICPGDEYAAFEFYKRFFESK